MNIDRHLQAPKVGFEPTTSWLTATLPHPEEPFGMLEGREGIEPSSCKLTAYGFNQLAYDPSIVEKNRTSDA